MEARLNTPFDSWGGFSTSPTGTMTYGRLLFHPEKGVKLELVENPQQTVFGYGQVAPLDTVYGKLVDGTLVTLCDCFISQASIQIGIGIGSPTKLTVNRAIFGRFVDDLNHLALKKYCVSLSSLANWTCTKPVTAKFVGDNEDQRGFDVTCRFPTPIDVKLPNQPFDLKIGHNMKMNQTAVSFVVEWEAGIIICAHDVLPFEAMHEIAWQCQNLLSLLIGDHTSIQKITLTPADRASEPPLHLVYQQIGKYDHPDAHAASMLLAYNLLKDKFPQMVANWFARTEQAVLAADIFFGSSRLEWPAVNARFLAAVQAAESYHRSLGTGVYMDQAAYDTAIQDFVKHIPADIRGDHEASLRNRLKYGNEYALRKRLNELFARLPGDVQAAIATDVTKFIAKVVDTRNYYTHYDRASQFNTFEPKSSYIAAERLRILVTANLLHDLGIKHEELLMVLQRNKGFHHWMSQPLPL